MGPGQAIPAALAPVELPPEAGDVPVPRYVDCFLDDAEDRVEELEARMRNGRFVPGDCRYAYQVLAWLLGTGRIRPGAAFLEWGSGQGMVTILAALLGYAATGVEIDEALVQEARELAGRYDAPARFEHGTYDARAAGLKVITAKKRTVVYVYPWPGEEPFFLQLFAETAPSGAWLLMGLGPADIRVFRRRDS